jgi:hypothetical protein
LWGFAGHLVHDGGRSSLRPDRYSPDDGTAAIVTAASLVGLLAHFVYRDFGLSTVTIDALTGRLRAGVSADTLLIEGATQS